MKKLATLLLAAGMVLGGFAGAQAIEWRAKGGWEVGFGYFQGTTFSKHTAATQRASDARTNLDGTNDRKKQYGSGNSNKDNFVSAQRTNWHIEAVANEYLLGKVQFEMGAYQWGDRGTTGDRSAGGAMGQRGVSVGVRESYLDFFMPGTEFRLRMGLQTFWNPSFSFTPMVLAHQLPGVVASFKAADEVSVTAFWLRPYNDNYTGVANAETGLTTKANSRDNFDIFGAAIPVSIDGLKVTPWGMYATIGSNAIYRDHRFVNGYDGFESRRISGLSRGSAVEGGMTPHHWQTSNWKAMRKAVRGSAGDSTAFWGGLTGDVTMMDPLRIAWDFNYGQVTNPDLGFMNRNGWIVNLLVEYKQDWGIPGLGLWWGSGDDGNPTNGSEQMPILDVNSRNSTLSSFGSDGSPVWAGGSWEGNLGAGIMSGTRGFTLRVRDMSFADKMKHTLRFNLYNGTNDPKMGKMMVGRKDWKGDAGNITDFNSSNGVYLTTLDYAFEVNLDTEYKIYDNLSMLVELGYINLAMNKKTWGSYKYEDPYDSTQDKNVRGVSTTNAVKAGLLFRYTF